MNNNYLEFNNWAFQYYLERNSVSNLGTLAIEVTEIENYCKENNCDLKFEEIISNDWSKLLQQGINNIPKYFGLIALQCYAASLMQNDSETSATDYQTRFIQLSGISDVNELQNISKEKINELTIQEKVWIEAEKFLSTKGINIKIPKIKDSKGKYIQYPLSQVILNQEDLKEYINFFIEIEKIFDGLSFNKFQKYFKNNIDKYQFKRKNNLKTNRLEYEINIKLKQIFDFYCSENWKIIEESSVTNKIKSHESKYILYYNELEETKIKLYNNEYDSISFSKVIFQKTRISGIIFFKKSKEYENEFDSVNYLENDAEYILVANNDSNLNDLKILSKYFETINYNDEKVYFFKGKIDIKNIPEEFIELINEQYPLELIGIKISRKREYLICFPPTINNSKDVNYRVQPEYNINDVKAGKYQIRVPGFSNLNFEIIEIPKLKSIVHLRNVGLKINDLNIVETNHDVQGLYYSGNTELKDESLNINNWINAQTKKAKRESSNIILKALIQNKYGK